MRITKEFVEAQEAKLAAKNKPKKGKSKGG
jgi:hypothetical protein